ncbi:hypothetical protein DBV15_01472 [Temnothorax longispinosus]|uniref:Uncharacterized protein n=1 Tax=Temnothorax longispinosus TaxID=300112 RepID=A0A4S2KYT6_9HYME|nr:hypothetical protein DBV15_01472 [Temnothorax longispinosus]
MSIEEERAHVSSILVYLFKNLPTCLESFDDKVETQLKEKVTQEIDDALMTYRTVYRQKYVPNFDRHFRRKQIVQVYLSLLSEGNAKCPDAWHKALKLEADREEKFLKSTMTNTTIEMITILMEKLQVPSVQWCLFLDMLLMLRRSVLDAGGNFDWL